VTQPCIHSSKKPGTLAAREEKQTGCWVEVGVMVWLDFLLLGAVNVSKCPHNQAVDQKHEKIPSSRLGGGDNPALAKSGC
jgi:hypothetical protein